MVNESVIGVGPKKRVTRMRQHQKVVRSVGEKDEEMMMEQQRAVGEGMEWSTYCKFSGVEDH